MKIYYIDRSNPGFPVIKIRIVNKEYSGNNGNEFRRLSDARKEYRQDCKSILDHWRDLYNNPIVEK